MASAAGNAAKTVGKNVAHQAGKSGSKDSFLQRGAKRDPELYVRPPSILTNSSPSFYIFLILFQRPPVPGPSLTPPRFS